MRPALLLATLIPPATRPIVLNGERRAVAPLEASGGAKTGALLVTSWSQPLDEPMSGSRHRVCGDPGTPVGPGTPRAPAFSAFDQMPGLFPLVRAELPGSRAGDALRRGALLTARLSSSPITARPNFPASTQLESARQQSLHQPTSRGERLIAMRRFQTNLVCTVLVESGSSNHVANDGAGNKKRRPTCVEGKLPWCLQLPLSRECSAPARPGRFSMAAIFAEGL